MLFRRTDKYGYSNYYGGSGVSVVIKTIVLILVVIALAIVLAIFGLKRFIHYTDDGAQLILPWSQTEGETGTQLSADGSASATGNTSADTPANDSGDISTPVVIEDGSASAEPEQEPQQTTPQNADLVQLNAIHVTITDLKAGKAASKLDSAGANGVMLYFKESSGSLYYRSSLDMASTLNVNYGTEGTKSVQQQLKALQDAGYYAIAYVDCFQDNTMGSSKDYALLDSGNHRWKDDTDDLYWTDPSNQEVQSYLSGLVKEIADLGFDEIVLNNACYPTDDNGDLTDVDTGSDSDRADTVTTFYTTLRDAVKDTDTVLSVFTTEATIQAGSNEQSGQTLENMAVLGGRVWVALDGASEVDLQNSLSEAGMADNSLCLLTGALDTSSTTSQVVLD